MGRKTVAHRRRFLKKNAAPPTPSPTPTPPSSPLKIPTPPPQPSPPPSPPPPPPQPSPPPSPPKPNNPPPSTSKRRFKTFASKNSTTKNPSTTNPKPRKLVTRSANSPAPKSISAATSDASPSRKRKVSTFGKSSSKKLKDSSVKILSGRVLPTDWVKQSEFKFFLDALQSQGWVKLMDYNAGVYETEIAEFYKNLGVNEDLVLSSYVNGTTITLTVTELAQILGVPSSGFSKLPYQSWPLLSGIDNATISRTLSDQPLPYAQIFSVSRLSDPHKLFRNLITKSVLPRIENRSECLIMDQVLLWLMIHDIPIRLPHLMILHMKNLSQSSLYYPYGLWLTKVFEAFDVICPHTKGVTCTNVMTAGMLSKMDLCVMNGELVKKDFRGCVPKEACVGCLKLGEEVREMRRQLQQISARQHASDTIAAQRHRQLMSKP